MSYSDFFVPFLPEGLHSGKCPPGAIKSTATLIGTSIQTPDPLTLRLQLAHTAGYFLAELTFPASWAVPQALIERYTQPAHYSQTDSNGSTSTWTQHLLDQGSFGGNLYVLRSWQHTDLTQPVSLLFERNERFWGKKPLLKRIEYALPFDAATAWSDFSAGKRDVSVLPAAAVAAARRRNDLVVQQTALLTHWYMTPNWQRAPFDDVRIRQAFSLALDRTTVLPANFRALWQPTIHLVPEGIVGYNPNLTDAAGRKGKAALAADLSAARAGQRLHRRAL